MTLNFSQLLAPLSEAEFFYDYWEKKPLVLTGRGQNNYETLISLKEVDFLLFSLTSPLGAESGVPWVKFFNNKVDLKLEPYLGKNGLFHFEKVMAGFKEGNTIILNRLDQRWNPIRELNFHLEEVFGHPIGTNLYLTPPNAQGFRAHYDPHDVLILQIEGEKLWKIYDQYEPFPLDKMERPYFGPLEAPRELVLKPGDLLYIPRGHVHEALTSNTYSLHLTVGIYVLSWVDLIAEMALQNPSMRRALPRGLLLSKNSASLDELKEFAFDLEAAEQALQTLRARFSANRKVPFEGHISKFADAEKIGPATLLKKTGDGAWNLKIEGENAFVYSKSLHLAAPFYTFPLLEHMKNTLEFSVQTLPDFFSEDSKLALVKALFKSGLLTPAP